MPPLGSMRGSHGLKTTSSLNPAPKSKKTKKSKGTAPEVIDIMKPGSDEANIKLRHAKDQELQDSILPGETLPVVELDKINLTEGGEDMPPPDAPGPIIPTYAPDEETRAATETWSAVEATTNSRSSWRLQFVDTTWWSWLFWRWGANGDCLTISEKMCSAPVSQLPTPNTLAGSISTITVGILPPARVLAEDLTKATLREGSWNLLQMALKCAGKQATSESTDSCSAGEWGGTKSNQASSSKTRVLTMHSSGPGSSGGAAGGTGQDPNELRQGVSHLAMVISDDDKFTDDPHQIIPTEDAFALSYLPRQNLKGFNWGYLLPAEVTAFRGIYYHKSMSGPATLVCLPGITLWIIKGTWPQDSTPV